MAFFEEHSGKVWAALISAISGAILWLVRTVFTDNKRLDVQAAQLKELHRDVQEIKGANTTAVQTQAKIVEMLREMRDSK